jgi:hypothetical protein
VVKTKEVLSSNIQLGDSQEPSRSPSKKEVLNIDMYLKDRKELGRSLYIYRISQQKKIRAQIST